VSGFPLDGDVGVLRHVEGIEAALLGGLGCLSRRDPAIAGEQDDAVTHGTRLERVSVQAKQRSGF
jgi:hypothetical protein